LVGEPVNRHMHPVMLFRFHNKFAVTASKSGVILSLALSEAGRRISPINPYVARKAVDLNCDKVAGKI
jgi:hypothetical protein